MYIEICTHVRIAGAEAGHLGAKRRGRPTTGKAGCGSRKGELGCLGRRAGRRAPRRIFSEHVKSIEWTTDNLYLVIIFCLLKVG